MDEYRDNRMGPADTGEMQPPRREPLLNLPGVIVAVILVTVAVELIVTFVLDETMVEALYYYGGFIPARYAGSLSAELLPAITSPVTYAFLHGGWEHLIFNDVWLAVFGTPVALRIGPVRFLLLWLVTSVLSAFAFDIANVASLSLLVGASGAISGLTGAACRFVWAGSGLRNPALSIRHRRLSVIETLKNREVLIFIGFWFVANVVLAGFGVGAPGGAQAIAWQAHLGGFLAGFLLFPLFDPVRGGEAVNDTDGKDLL